MVKKVVAVAMIMTSVVMVAGCAKSQRTVENYCKAWKTDYTRLEKQFGATASNASEDPVGAVLGAMDAPDDLVVVFEDLAKVAPSEVQPDVESIRDSLKDAQAKSGDPLSQLASSFLNGLGSLSSYKRVVQYTLDNCGKPPYD